MFVKAQSPASPEYSQLIAHLRPRLSCPSIRVKSPPRTTPITQKPFLVNISKDDTPQYAPTYNLTSKTRTPRLCATADGQPFIRLKKPQPVALSKMIGRKGRLFQKKIMKVVEVDEELATAAALEDQWDDLIAAQMRREGISTKENDAIARERPSPNSFSWSVQLTRLWWEWQIERSWQDWVARGEALNRFVGERKGLDKEARTGLATSPGGGSTNSKRPLWNHSEPPNVGVHPTAPFPLLAAIKAQIGNSQAPSGKVIDPFLEVRWNALVEAEKGRLLRWIARNAANFNGSS
ncbi:hypothetical protein QQS21_011524 [Conoideocrella luteorostrata]|uniref:Uncharacterized protein n=1 Tax=Conoideocrella luteorostrata TaxID=1105319 RepID=A0AAJ0FNH6_9HYPO|nr:hypothetical protein QQS21_011524 [Conoideocrella luteorostrata]